MPAKESRRALRFGEKLRALRRKKALTAMQLAIAFGYSSDSHITHVETGKRRPTADFIVQVAEYFGVSTDVLLLDELDLEGMEEERSEE